jgi:hypothetical protein
MAIYFQKKTSLSIYGLVSYAKFVVCWKLKILQPEEINSLY